jgi:cell division septal protein FtsQ
MEGIRAKLPKNEKKEETEKPRNPRKNKKGKIKQATKKYPILVKLLK